MRRRRVLGITAACLAGAVSGAADPVERRHRWRGRALGGEAEITVISRHRRPAMAALERCVALLAALEAQFSLYRPDSVISRLNRDGAVAEAPVDFRRLLATCAGVSARSGGSFDITVQPLWKAQAAEASGAERARIARELVDWRRVRVAGRRVDLARPGMAITLNGVAQGYITDRLCDALADAGFPDVLVNAGEFRAGRGARRWRVGIGVPGNNDLAGVAELSDEALASSGSRAGVTGREHIFEPRSGSSGSAWRMVSVFADTATAADAWSTALCATPPSRVGDLFARSGARRALLVDFEGNRFAFGPRERA